MAGKSPLTATNEQRRRACGRLPAHAIAARRTGRAPVLPTLTGWTSPRIAEAFGVREDTGSPVAQRLIGGGIEALKASVAPGPAPVKSEAASA